MREHAMLGEALRRALRAGARRAEVFYAMSAGRAVEYTDRGFESYRGSESGGIGLRVFRGRRTGFSWGQDFSAGGLERLAVRAVEGATLADLPSFPTPPGRAAGGELGIHDAAGLAATVAEDRDRLEAEVAAAIAVDPAVKRVKKATLRSARRIVRVRATTGTDLVYERSVFSLGAGVVAERGGVSEMGWDADSASARGSLEWEAVGRRAAVKAAARLGAGQASGGRRPVVLDREVVAEFLGLLAAMLSADAVLKGKSLFAGKVGTRQVAAGVTIVDDPGLKGAVGSAPFDDEGQESRRKILVDAGVLRGYLHTLDTAHRMGTETSGNGFRAGFETLPQPRPSTLLLVPGTEAVEGLLGSGGRALLVDEILGAHTMNPVSGDFSVGAAGFEVGPRGRRPVRGATIAGNLRELFRSVEAVANDLRIFGGVAAPSVLVRELDVSA